MHRMFTYAYFCHQAMRGVFRGFPARLQQQMRQLQTDPLYQRLSTAATQPGNLHIILENYMSLLHYSGDGNDKRNTVSHALTRKGIRKISVPLKHLRGRNEWHGIHLESPLRDVPKERLRGSASTYLIGAQDFLDFVLRADLAPKGTVQSICASEVLARDHVREVITTEEEMPCHADDMIIFRHTTQPSSPNWHLYVNKDKGVFTSMNLGQGAGRRGRELEEAGFSKFTKGAKVESKCDIFNALRDQLRRHHVWKQTKLMCRKKRRNVFYLHGGKESVWDHIDRSLFDSECQRWLRRVWRVLSRCTGLETVSSIVSLHSVNCKLTWISLSIYRKTPAPRRRPARGRPRIPSPK